MLFFSSIFVLSAVVMHLFNPQHLQWHESAPLAGPPFADPWIFQNESVEDSEIIQYRGGLNRLGNFGTSYRGNLGLPKVVPLHLNTGAHSASKSSPIEISDGWILVGDFGRVVRLGFDGKERWEFRVLNARYGMHATPAIMGSHLVVADYAGQLINLDVETGQPRWILPLGTSIGASPLLTPDGFIYAAIETTHPNGFLAKIRLQDGQIEWLSSWLGQHSHSSPSYDSDHHAIVIGDNRGFISSFDAETGEIRWKTLTGAEVKATPAISGGKIYLSSWDGFLYVLNAQNGHILHQIDLGRPQSNQSSVAIAEKEQLGFINSRSLCRFSLKEPSEFKCVKGIQNLKAVRRSSPVIYYDKKGNLMVVTSCQARGVCVVDGNSLSLRQNFLVSSAQTGEIHLGKRSISMLTSDEGDLVYWPILEGGE